MDFLSEGKQAESGLWLPGLHDKCWVQGSPCYMNWTWRAQRMSSPLAWEMWRCLFLPVGCLPCSVAGSHISGFSLLPPMPLLKTKNQTPQMERLQLPKSCLLPVWIVTGNLTEAPIQGRDEWFSLTLKRKAHQYLAVVRYSHCLMELYPWQHCSLYSCSGGGRCKAVWGGSLRVGEDRSSQAFMNATPASAAGDRLVSELSFPVPYLNHKPVQGPWEMVGLALWREL